MYSLIHKYQFILLKFYIQIFPENENFELQEGNVIVSKKLTNAREIL